jgi:outer membrane protein TolC
LNLNKIKKQEYYLTRSEFLRSQTKFQDSSYKASIENEALAHLLGDRLDTTYKPLEELKFETINTSQDESIRLAITQSPTYRDAKLDFLNSNRAYKQTVKKQLPLPKIDLNLGAYNVGYNGLSGRQTTYKTTEYNDGSYNSNVELVATINMTWTLFGENGFLNSRQRERAFLDKKISEVKYYDAKRQVDVEVRTLYRNIRYLERQSKVTEKQLSNSRKSFDFTLDAYINKRAKYADLKIALDNMINSRVEFENAKYVHLTQKLKLSDLMGLDDFPGSNFENLAVK